MVDCFFVLGLGLSIGIISLLVEILKQRGKKQPASLPPLRVEKKTVQTNGGKSLVRIVVKLLKKVKKGCIYDHAGCNDPPATLATIPHSYYTYNRTPAPLNDRAAIGNSSWNGNLQRQQKMYYFQKRPEMNRKLLPTDRFYWFTAVFFLCRTTPHHILPE